MLLALLFIQGFPGKAILREASFYGCMESRSAACPVRPFIKPAASPDYSSQRECPPPRSIYLELALPFFSATSPGAAFHPCCVPVPGARCRAALPSCTVHPACAPPPAYPSAGPCKTGLPLPARWRLPPGPPGSCKASSACCNPPPPGCISKRRTGSVPSSPPDRD